MNTIAQPRDGLVPVCVPCGNQLTTVGRNLRCTICHEYRTATDPSEVRYERASAPALPNRPIFEQED